MSSALCFEGRISILGWVPKRQTLSWGFMSKWFIKSCSQEKSAREWGKQNKEGTCARMCFRLSPTESGLDLTLQGTLTFIQTRSKGTGLSCSQAHCSWHKEPETSLAMKVHKCWPLESKPHRNCRRDKQMGEGDTGDLVGAPMLPTLFSYILDE